MSEVQTRVKSMIQNGQDPKEYLLEVCRPTCIAKQERLQRCENKLKAMTHADPELSCMYPMRDWVTCVDACVNNSLKFRSNLKFTPTSSVMKLDGCHDSFNDLSFTSIIIKIVSSLRNINQSKYKN